MAEIWRGAAVAAALKENVRQRVAALAIWGAAPRLAIVRVGENGAQIAYEKSAVRCCEDVGIATNSLLLPADITQEELIAAIGSVNNDAGFDGCLLLRPLPPGIDDALVCAALLPEKDVDGITTTSLAGVFTGSHVGFAPCTPEAVIDILDYHAVELRGKLVTIVGSSLVVGKPLAMLLLERGATIELCHIDTRDVPARCREAEIVIAAAGAPGVIDRSCASPGQIVLDVGITLSPDGKLLGDVAFAEVEPIVAAITPVPGGVGAVTTAVLVRHIVAAAEQNRQINEA